MPRKQFLNTYLTITDGKSLSLIAHVYRYADGNKYRPLDISITKNVFALLIAALVVCICIFPLARFYRRNKFKAPRKGLGAIEFVIDMVYSDVIRPILGVEARRFAPYLLTLFFFILAINILGMIVVFPGGANLSGNISITLVLALCTFLVVNFMGTKHYCKYVGRPSYSFGAYFPYIYFWDNGSSSFGRNNRLISVVFCVYESVAFSDMFYSGLCIYNAFSALYKFGKSEGRKRDKRIKLMCNLKKQTLC